MASLFQGHWRPQASIARHFGQERELGVAGRERRITGRTVMGAVRRGAQLLGCDRTADGVMGSKQGRAGRA